MSHLRRFFGTFSTTRLWLVLWLVPYLGFGSLGQAGHVHQLPHLSEYSHEQHVLHTASEMSLPGDAECLLCQWLSDAGGWAPPLAVPVPTFTETSLHYSNFYSYPGTRPVQIRSARGPPAATA